MQCYVITVISLDFVVQVGTLRVETVGFFLILILPVTIPASLTDKFSKVVII